MSTLDLLGLGAMAAGAATGALTGALRQVVHLAALGTAALLAPALSPLLAGPVARVLPQRGLAAPVAAFVSLSLAFALLSIAGHLVLRAREARSRRSPSDRGLGALLGGAQAAVGLWAILSLLVLWDRPLGGKDLRLDPRQGELCSFAREHNLLEAVLPTRLKQLREEIPALRKAVESGSIEAAGEAARKAREALERAERAGKQAE